MRYSHKAQLQSKLFFYLVVAVVILLLLIFAYTSLKETRERARAIEQKKLEQEIKFSLEEIEYGSVEQKKLTVPAGTKEICFIDITKRTKLLNSPILKADKYIKMTNIIKSGEKKNIFFITQQEPYITSTYQPGICFEHYPYFACIEARANILNLYIEGKGKCALIVQEYKVCENVNYKEDGKTTASELSFGSIYAKLTIPADIELQPAPKDICIEAVSYIGDGLISEVYNITPEHITTTQTVRFDLKYENYLLPSNTDPGHIKLKKSSSPWVTLDNVVVDIEYNRVYGDTLELSYVAVFGPESPRAKMRVNNGNLIPDELPEGTEIIVAKNSIVNFDASESFDPDNDITLYRWDFGDDTIEEGPPETHKTITHSYAELGSYNVSLTVTDLTGYKNTLKIIVTVVNDANKKRIPDGTIFLISNPDWREILSLVPLTMWKGMAGNQKIPFLVYHTEFGITFNDFKITGTDGLKKKYYPDKDETAVSILVYTDESLLQGKTADNIHIKSLQLFETDYLSYWLDYEDIVIIGYNNQEDALMASLFAAFINAPIIFIDDNHIPADGVIQGKIAHVVDYNDLITSNTIPFLGKADNIKKYSLSDLKNPAKNQYQRLNSKIALISS